MSDDQVAVSAAPEDSDATFEQGGEPKILESFQAISEVGGILGRTSITDYGVAVIAEQIESLRSTAKDVDHQYRINVRGRKINFKDRVD